MGHVPERLLQDERHRWVRSVSHSRPDHRSVENNMDLNSAGSPYSSAAAE